MEREFHNWLIKNHQPKDEHIIVGLGDDAAVVQFDGPVVITSDTIADQVHFDTGKHSLSQIANKAINVSISDIAAMGARPIAASVDLFLPKTMPLSDLKTLFESLATAANNQGASIVGGDTNRWGGTLVLSTNVYGTPIAPDNQTWRISGAHPGDLICVTGELGGSILSKHLSFSPRTDVAVHLAKDYQISAATDISDSLAADLAAIAAASQCGFAIDESAIPVSQAAIQLSHQDNISPLDHALYDGEDFELILCMSESEWNRLSIDVESPCKPTIIGTLTAEQTYKINRDGRLSELEIRGYEH